MAYIFYWFSFGYSLDHFFLTFFPFDQFLDQLIIHNCSPINRLSMTCSKDHHGRVITKILHLIFLINNGQNYNNSIDIFWFHFLHNPPFISVVNIWDSVNYIWQCYYGILQLYLVCFCLFCMVDLENLCQHIFL